MDEGHREELGKRVRKLRQDQGFTQESLARAVGVTRETIRRLEAGEATPSMSLLYRLAEALGLAASELLESPAPSTGTEGPQ